MKNMAMCVLQRTPGKREGNKQLCTFSRSFSYETFFFVYWKFRSRIGELGEGGLFARDKRGQRAGTVINAIAHLAIRAPRSVEEEVHSRRIFRSGEKERERGSKKGLHAVQRERAQTSKRRFKPLTQETYVSGLCPCICFEWAKAFKAVTPFWAPFLVVGRPKLSDPTSSQRCILKSAILR